MAFAPITAADAASYLRAEADDPRLLLIVAGVNAYLSAVPLRDALPADTGKVAAARMTAYIFDAPDTAAGQSFASAYVNSGAGSLLSRWTIRRASSIAAAREES